MNKFSGERFFVELHWTHSVLLPKIKATEITLSYFLYPHIQFFIDHHIFLYISYSNFVFQSLPPSPIAPQFLSVPHIKDSSIYSYSILLFPALWSGPFSPHPLLDFFQCHFSFLIPTLVFSVEWVILNSLMYLIFYHMSLCGLNTLHILLVYLSSFSTVTVKICVFPPLSPSHGIICLPCGVLLQNQFSFIASFSYMSSSKEKNQNILLTT